MNHPKYKLRTRLKKGLLELNRATAGGVHLIANSGPGIENARACRGRAKFPRPSRSRYSPVEEDRKHGITQ